MFNQYAMNRGRLRCYYFLEKCDQGYETGGEIKLIALFMAPT